MTKEKLIFYGVIIFSIFAIFSCTMFDVQEPVEEFFDYNTATSKISRYEFSGQAFHDEDGSISVLPGQDFRIRFYLDNPQNFSFARGSNLETDLDDEVSVFQDGSEVIEVDYPADFLTEGKIISPRITLYHPVSHADFGTYDGLNLVCNSRPPAISSAEVAVDSGEYVILFSAPSSARLLNDASDITKFYFNEKTVSVSVDSSGAIQGLPSASGFSSSYDFAYWTGVNESAGAQNFSIGWVDRYGVKSAGMNPSAQNFVISFSENIPSGVSVSASGIPSGGTFMQGADFTIPSAVPTLAGYSFAGYATSANGSVTYSAGQTISVSGDMELFAVWSSVKTLSGNVTVSSVIQALQDNSEVEWTLQSGNNSVSSSIQVSSGKTLTIKGTNTGETLKQVSFSGGIKILEVQSGGKLILDGITIDGTSYNNSTAIYCSGGEVVIRNSTIKNMENANANNAGAIFITGGGTVTMESGTITACGGNQIVGIVSVGTSSPAVNVENGKFVMSGGQIVSCGDANSESVIFVSSGGIFEMSGGVIKDNTVSSSGFVVSGSGTFNKTGGANCTDTINSSLNGSH
jgi:hypothetical protein